MKAILMTGPGGPEVLKLTQVDDPVIPQGNDLLIQMRAAGVNPIDTKLRSRGTFYPNKMPAVLGCDGAGVIEAMGSAVSDFKVGDQVYFCHGGLGDAPGNYAEYATVDAHSVALKPRNYSFEEAAAAPLVLITAWEALHDRAGIEAGQKVLIHGGAGGVGHVAIQLAKAAGADVITTVSSKAKAKVARDLGADEVIDYTREDVAQKCLAWTDGQGVDIAFDTVGGKTFSDSFPAVKIYGNVVTILEPDMTTQWKVARERNLRISFELMLTPMLKNMAGHLAHQGEILKQCARLADKGQLAIKLAEALPMEKVVEAHRRIEAGGMVGKLVLKI